MSVTGSQLRPLSVRGLLWSAAGCALQAGIFLWDLATPLGFAHGVLYAPAVFLGLAVRRHTAIWLLTTLGILGTVLGMWGSAGRLPAVSDTYILLNRLLGITMVLLAGITSTSLLHLSRRRMASQTTLERMAALLEMSSTVGRLGGWRVELPEQVSYWSDQVFRLLDQPPGAIPDIETIIRRYVPEHRVRIREAFRACVSHGRPFDEELQVLCRDGQRRWVRVVGEAVRSAGGSIQSVQGAMQDINGYKLIQADLENSRAAWESMAESLPMMLWVADAQGSVLYMNQFAADYTAAQTRELLGSGWVQYLHVEDLAYVKERWAAALTSRQPYDAEFRVRRHDGVWCWHLARAICVTLPTQGEVRWYGTAMDIQRLRDEEKAKNHLAMRLADTMENVSDAIFMLDQDWRFSYLNSQAEQTLERSRDDLLGRNVWEEFPAARGSIFQEQYERCACERVTVRFDAAYSPLDKHFEVNAYPTDNGLMVYFRDVTKLRQQAEQLDQARRMESLGQLTGGVAHDFNNLLTVILGNAEVLADQYAATDSRRILATMIVNAAQRGAEMTQRLLAFARRQALQPVPTDLNRLVLGFAPLLRRTVGKTIQIELSNAPDLWLTMVDPGQLEMALLNLVVNARDAMPGGGHISIETDNTYLDANYAAKHVEVVPGEYVALTVSDTGCGIKPELLSRSFELFLRPRILAKEQV